MKNYNPNIRWGTHLIKVSFQRSVYKGFITFERGGNCKGLDVLTLDIDDLYVQKFKENPINFRVLDADREWFAMNLRNDGNELLIENEWDNLGNYIVGIEILEFKKNKEDAKC